MSSIGAELALIMVAAMLSPTTLTATVLALVLGERPLRTGFWFFLGAFGLTLVIGVIAAFVLGNSAASPKPSSPKTWVAVVDVVAGVFILGYVIRAARRPPKAGGSSKMIDQMSKVASSPAVAIFAAGATLANPGGFIPLALKDISELNPNAGQYVVLWLTFAIVSLLPLLIALVLLAVAPDTAKRVLQRAREFLDRRSRTIIGVLLILLAISLLSHGINGLAS